MDNKRIKQQENNRFCDLPVFNGCLTTIKPQSRYLFDIPGVHFYYTIARFNQITAMIQFFGTSRWRPGSQIIRVTPNISSD